MHNLPRRSTRLTDGQLRTIARRALAEDRWARDVTTRAVIPHSVPARAAVTAQARGILAGMSAAVAVARVAGLVARSVEKDGSSVRPGRVVLRLEGDGRRILAAERTLLNFLMHLSGVATLTAEAVAAARASAGRRAPVILATRKTLPGLRDLEKAAVVAGGGHPHRRDLESAVLIKNNHLALVGLETAMARARSHPPVRAPVEVEVRSEAEALMAARLGAEALLLDNVSPTIARRTIRYLTRHGPRPRPFVELSGGITLDNLRLYARTGVDAISLGALTHSAPALPFHLTLRRGRARPPPT